MESKTLTIPVFAMAAILMISSFVIALPDLGLGSENSVSVNANMRNSGVNTHSENKANWDSSYNIGMENNVNALTKTQINQRARIHAVTEDDVERSIKIVNSEISTRERATSFVHVFSGTGWATSSESGNLLGVVWAEKTFVLDGKEETRTNGILRMDREVPYHLSLTEETDSSMELDIQIEGKNEGTLILKEESSYEGFTVWTGELSLSEETYEVHLATTDTTIKGESEVNVKIEGQVYLSDETMKKVKELRNVKSDNSVKVKIKAQKEGEEVTVEVETEGSLTAEQEEILEDLKTSLESDLKSTEGNASVEINSEANTDTNSGNGARVGFWTRLRGFVGLR